MKKKATVATASSRAARTSTPVSGQSSGPRSRASAGVGRTPNAILEAALGVFAREGFDGASIPAIAKAADIGHPLVHYHFGSKENLWRTAVDYAFGDLAQSIAVLEAAAISLEPVDALKLLCRGFAQFTARHPLHTLIIFNELRTGGDRFDWLIERYLRPLHARLDAVIAAAVATGRIRPVPAAHLSSIVIGAAAHFFGAAPLIARLYDIDVQDPEVIEAHATWAVEILMNGLAVVPEAASPSMRRSKRSSEPGRAKARPKRAARSIPKPRR